MPENLTLEYFSKLLSDDSFEVTDEASVVSTFRQAQTLAADAFEHREQHAFDLAERLLHFNFRQNGFMHPSGTLASIICSVLSQSKIGAAFRNARSNSVNFVGDLRQILEEAVRKLGGFNHPLLTAISESPDRANELRIWAKNFAASGREFTSQLFVLGAHCTTTSLQDFVVENLHEEFDGTPHIELRTRFFGRLGIVHPAPVDYSDPELQTEFLAQSNFRTCLVNLRDPFYGFGSFFVTESNWGLEAGVLHNNFKNLGFSKSELEFLSLHHEADEGHAAEWMEVISKAAVTDEQKSRVILAGISQLLVRRQMYDALYSRLFGSR